MIKIVAPTALLKALTLPVRVSRLVTFILILSSLVACAVAPTQPVVSEPVEPVEAVTGAAAAADMYNNRNYPAALEAFDNVIADTSSSASDLVSPITPAFDAA